jgi:hypothetical protein
MSSEPVADLWVSREEAAAGVSKRFLFEGKVVQVMIPSGTVDDTLLRLSGLKPRSIPFLRPVHMFVKVHVFETVHQPVDYTPYSDHELNTLVRHLTPWVRVINELDPKPLYDHFEQELSVEDYAESILVHMSASFPRESDLEVPAIRFQNIDLPGRFVTKTTTRRAVSLKEDHWIEVNGLYRYHTRVLGAILAHELMHFVLAQAHFAWGDIPSSFRQRPTQEAMVDIGSILAGAGRLYQEAILAYPGGIRQVFGYIDPSVIVRTRTLALGIHNVILVPPRCTHCGGGLSESRPRHWTCRKCNMVVNTV